MLTGDEIMSGGEAILSGTSLRSNRSEYLSNIGYCPQFDSIIDVMTGIRRFFNFRVPSWFSHAQNFYFLEICLNLFEIWNFLSPLKIYLKFGPCGVVQYACIQPHYVIRLNTCISTLMHLAPLCKVIVWNRFFWRHKRNFI